jgi:16S rRNA (guanine966-N2)-methyltransferase
MTLPSHPPSARGAPAVTSAKTPQMTSPKSPARTAPRGKPGQGGGQGGAGGAQGRHGQAAQLVRILGGQWKRTPLPVLEVAGLRPTPSRVRETLFNWLGQDLSGLRCVDAFAGTGALGLEAASRGATEVVLLEQHHGLASQLRRTTAHLKATQVRVECADALVALRRMAGGGWDVVFLDPPFLQGDNDSVYQQALRAAALAIAPSGVAYLESPRVWSDAELAELGWQATRRGRAGVVHHSLLKPLPGGAAAGDGSEGAAEAVGADAEMRAFDSTAGGPAS